MSGGVQQVASEADFSVLTASGACMIDFYADWCGPCKRIGERLRFFFFVVFFFFSRSS
jgi:thiol:disulfide interchange protein